MNRKNGTATEVADLVLQLGRAAYAQCASGGLTQAQWIALRFFARANRFSRNVSGFAAFHATTRGTASQTIKSLVEQGYLVGTPSPKDGRSTRLDLTQRARDRLREDPLEDVVRATDTLAPAQQAATAAGLRTVLNELDRHRERPDIGVCRLCGHRQSNTGGNYRCRLMDEALEEREIDELCARFQLAK